MRPTLRLLARVKAGKYLENFAPTGLTGLTTHPNPRPTLIYLYNETLDRLKAIPESSVYRQSTEALTRKRLGIVESVKPAGFDAWLQRVKAAVEENPEAFKSARKPDGTYVAIQRVEVADPEGVDFGGPTATEAHEGPYFDEEQTAAHVEALKKDLESGDPQLHWEAEPALEASQVSELENQIGAGLIEEVIQVAQGELRLVDDMIKHKVWEDLEEKPKPGQWTYFER